MNYNFNNPIIYFFSRDDEFTAKRLNDAIDFYNKLPSIRKKIVFDVCKVNRLKYKSKLNSLLIYNNDFELCLLSERDLGVNLKELYTIFKFCKLKNIKIFNLEKKEYILY